MWFKKTQQTNTPLVLLCLHKEFWSEEFRQAYRAFKQIIKKMHRHRVPLTSSRSGSLPLVHMFSLSHRAESCFSPTWCLVGLVQWTSRSDVKNATYWLTDSNSHTMIQRRRRRWWWWYRKSGSFINIINSKLLLTWGQQTKKNRHASFISEPSFLETTPLLPLSLHSQPPSLHLCVSPTTPKTRLFTPVRPVNVNRINQWVLILHTPSPVHHCFKYRHQYLCHDWSYEQLDGSWVSVQGWEFWL